MMMSDAEEDRARHLGGGAREEPPAVAGRVGHEVGLAGRVVLGAPADEVLHHDDGAVDDQAEVDRAERHQVRRHAEERACR